ncbi:MAG TPA: COX15/CtaA family protein [Burkholderiaceae bacterium]
MTPPAPAAAPTAQRRIALVCALLVLVIAGVSAFLRLSKVGLGCEPWPACYGQELRTLQRGEVPDAASVQAVALARLAHRILASTALVLVIVLAMAALTRKPVRRGEATLALSLLAVALSLAGLGWFTAGSRVPAVALGNLLGGFVMLALSWRLGVRDVPSTAQRQTHARWAAVALAVVGVQVALGGLLSASHSTFSCSDTSQCLRQVALDGWRWQWLDPWREPLFEATSALPVNPQGALVNLLHRAWALLVVLAILPTAWLAWRHGHRGPAAALVSLLVLQFALGLWLAGSGATVAAALVHNLLAALMVGMLARLV